MIEKIKLGIQQHMSIWYLIPILIIIGSITAFFVIDAQRRVRNEFVFNEHLGEMAFMVNDTEITLREAAYYILVIESNVNATALEYNENNPVAYWNIYLNDGENSNFLRDQAKEDTMNACIRDGIYYNEALSAGIELSDEEEKECSDNAYEQEKTLTGKQQQVTGYDYGDMYEMLRKIAINKKYMSILMDEGYTEEQLDVGGEYYEELKMKYEIEVNEELWENVNLGRLTIN